MNELDWLKIKQMAIMWVKEASNQLKASLVETIRVETKSSPDDLVTEMDRKIEQYFLRKIQAHFPNHAFLGEEGISGEEYKNRDTIWIIDPIDGTTNFVHQQYNFAISVAVYHKGEGKVGLIYDVMNDDLYHAMAGDGAYKNDDRLERLTPVDIDKAIIGLNARWLLYKKKANHLTMIELVDKVRGVRSYGSAALEMAYVASGRLDGYVSLKLSPWDFAAALVLLKEVGGCYSTFYGESLAILKSSSVFVGRPQFHQKVIQKFVHKELKS
ncbi:inositol monophosphatase family protein [Alkalihalobacillus sp. BA299]|uniref:inositol monophosphatase family protein n=1 Tax=Alkalihalobacillus sp. BA299 TaxID=2815938 RepID=UPI001ADAE718|nr:inositol monophosphatase [Alkalihalobacillus sp. BA299]